MFILFLPTQFALDLQLLGGVWILQTFPAVVFGLFFNWFRAPALLIGWAVGILGGLGDRVRRRREAGAHADDRRRPYTVYTGLLALVINVVVALIAQLVLGATKRGPAVAVAR